MQSVHLSTICERDILVRLKRTSEHFVSDAFNGNLTYYKNHTTPRFLRAFSLYAGPTPASILSQFSTAGAWNH